MTDYSLLGSYLGLQQMLALFPLFLFSLDGWLDGGRLVYTRQTDLSDKSLLFFKEGPEAACICILPCN
jgi:hypothetical protein